LSVIFRDEKGGLLQADQNHAFLDTLTGLLKRESFSRHLAELVSAANEEKHTFSLAMIDIDHFKSINDGFGHSRGDEILTEFGRRIISISREGDLLFRYGGDEFTVILPDADSSEAEKFAVRLLDACTRTQFAGDPPLSVTLSIGIAHYPEDGLSARELFDSADRRLFAAKRQGRNRVLSFDDPVHPEESGIREGRLLGREKELALFVAFAQEAADKGRGFFLVLGPDGAGKGCFLDACASYLSMSDYTLLTVSGGADPQADHSALADALECPLNRRSVVDALYSHAGASMSLGVFLKDMHLIDRVSIEDLSEFYSLYPGWMIVVASTERTAPVDGDGFGGISASTRLGPVSLEDCRAWFRACLMWNPPDDFLEWFHDETGGLPGMFLQGVHHLERRGYLVPKNGTFVLEEDYRDFSLGSRIAFGSTAEINNLPVDLTPFTGREVELESIRELMDRGSRLITLRGMSGMGCRRLAIRAAGQNEFMFPEGVCIVDCSADGASVPVKLASEFSLPSGRNAAETVAGFIENSRMLLLFTNVSPGDETVSFISELLKSSSGVTVIATSRSSLDIPGEAVVSVEGVSTLKPDEETPSHAARILIQTAERLAGIRFPGELKLNLVEEICNLLGGSPLAIELAASWTRVMSVTAICRRIRANPSFLGGSDKEKTTDGLADLFQQSWDQLSSVEKHAISRLTVFAGHFTVEEAEEISDVTPEMVLSLVDRSFLLRDDMGIHIPAMTRDFIIQEKNPFSRGFEVAREMHCRYFASRASFYGEMAWTGVDASRGLDGIRYSFEDISLSWKLAIEKKRFRFLRQMLKPLTVYCQDRGRFRTGFNMLEEALKALGTDLPDGLAALMLAGQSSLAFRTGRSSVARRLMELAMDTSQGLRDPDRGTVLYTRGSIMVEAGTLSGALKYLEEAHSIFSGQNCTIETLETELEMVKYHLQTGNYSHVRRILPSLAEKCRDNSFRSGEWKTRLFMGKLAASEGDYRRARDSFLAYLSAVKAAGYTERCAAALNQLAEIEANQGSFGEAEQHYATAVDYYKRIGSIRGHAGVKINLAVMNQMRGMGEEVRKNYTEALVLGEKANDENIISGSLNGLAFYHLDNGDCEKAESFLVRAGETAERSGNKPVLIRVIYGFAVLDDLQDNPERAVSTAIALLHEPASNAESETSCMELLQSIRKKIGKKTVDQLSKEIKYLTLSDLIEMYIHRKGMGDETVYRKG